MRKILDASFVRQDPAHVRRLGYEALARYLALEGPSTKAKIITPLEAKEIRDAGLGLVLVWEQGPTSSTWNAAEANRQADELGFPADRPIFYAEDRDVSPSEYPTIAGKLRDLTGRPRGIYGESGLVEHCITAGAAAAGWIAASSAWSKDAAPSAALRQLVSDLVPGADENLVLRDDYGQWPAPTSSSTPTEDPNMTLTMVYPPEVYPATLADGSPHPKAGQRHPHAGEIWLAFGIFASHVSSPAMAARFNYVGAGGPTQIDAEWFDNLVLVPNALDPATTFPRIP